MKRRTVLAGGAAAFALAGCSGTSKFKRYDGPEVTYVVVNKGARHMYLLHNDTVLEQYTIDLGFAPIGDKFIEGDGRTPEGLYMIDRRNPNSRFHLSLGIDYPRPRDIEEARKLGKSPGGDIFIHGKSKPWKKGRNDWTWGCIAVTNREMEDIYAMVRNGTPIMINP
ncbi:MAG: L,D-transpeptidase family protein [Pseudomonadota bacterium]